MARSHALSAAAVWTTAAAASTAVGVHWTPAVVAVGTVVCAGSAILPDIDCPGSHAARSLGPVTDLLARATAALSRTVYARTATPVDRPDRRRGHRGLTHTLAFAVVCGLLVAGAAYTPAGYYVAVAVLAVTAAWAARAVLPYSTRHARIGGVRVEWAPLVGVAGAVALLAVIPGHTAWWWLGIPVAAGAVLHDLGDTFAHHPDYPAASSGISLLWPVKIHGQRWYRFHPPTAAMFPVNSWLEHTAALAFALITCAAALQLTAGAW